MPKICMCIPLIVEKLCTCFYNRAMQYIQEEIAAVAARMVVEEGLEYGSAKRRAVKHLGLPARTALPDNDTLETQVRDYIELFCADTQPQELRTLRELAVLWMHRLELYRPYLGGAVWHGTATKLSDIYLQLFCDDTKALEIELVNRGQHYTPTSVRGLHGKTVDTLSLHCRCVGLDTTVGVHLMVNDYDDVRGALHADSQGRRPRGNVEAVMELLSKDNEI
jgi:hypothetical protein